MKTGVERKNPYFINIISYDKDGNYYERMSFYAKNKERKLRSVFKKRILLSKYFWLEKTFWSDGYFVVQQVIFQNQLLKNIYKIKVKLNIL